MTTKSATIPIGTLTRNTQRHPEMPRKEVRPAKKPPMTGPRPRGAEDGEEVALILRPLHRRTMSPMMARARLNGRPRRCPGPRGTQHSWIIESAKGAHDRPMTKIVMAVRKNGLRP